MVAMIRIALPLALMAAPAAAAAQIESSPDLGKAEAHCGPNDAGPAVLITVTGLKDRKGLLRAELYPDNDRDFLGDDLALAIDDVFLLKQLHHRLRGLGTDTEPVAGAIGVDLKHLRLLSRQVVTDNLDKPTIAG